MRFICYRARIIFWCTIIFSLFVVVQAQQQIEITDFFAKVYLAPNTSSRFIGLAQKGETYPVLETRETWYRIRFKNAVGWIQQSQSLPSNGSTATASNSSAPSNTTATSPHQETTQVSANTTFEKASVQEQQSPYNTAVPNRDTSSTRNTYNQVSGTSQRSSPTRTETQSSTPPPAKPRKWFSQKNYFHNAPTEEIIDDTIKYFQVTMAPARVLTYLNPEAPILGMAKKGDLLQLIGEGDSWCKVIYADTIGWIEHKNGKIVNAPQSLLLNDLLTVGVIASVLLLIVLLLFIVIKISRRKRSGEKEPAVQKNVLIIAKSNKTIQYTLTDTTTTLDRCFTEIGFKITQAKDTASIRDAIEQLPFDILLVDWKFDRNIIPNLERLYSSRPEASRILIVVYNVPDPATMQAGKVFPMMHFLGLVFSDRDIFKLVTPLIISDNAKTSLQKSAQSSALEGNVGGGNLLEVLQFIEIGSKTGCLLIQTERPYGLIYFLNGRIVYAATAQEETGRDAIFKMLDQKNGTFRFILNRKPKTSNINLSTLEVLMEWTKAVDEAHGH